MARQAQVIWAAPALDALDEIAAWIAVDDEAATDRLVNKVLSLTERLKRLPLSGRRVPELPGSAYRELIVPPCRIVHRLQGKDVLVVMVIRSEQQLPVSRLK